MTPKRTLPLLALGALLLACGDDPAGPVDQPVAFYITVDDTEGLPLAAALLSFDGPVEQVRVSGGWALVLPAGERTLVALAMRAPLSRIGFTVVVPSSPQDIELLQVADGDNDLYPYPGAFTVELRELEALP